MRRRRYRVTKWLGPMAVVAFAALAAPVAGADISPVSSFIPISQPTADYVNGTCRYDLSGIPNRTHVNKLTGCGKLTFSATMHKASVPESPAWRTWGSPPDTESATPDLLAVSGGGR